MHRFFWLAPCTRRRAGHAGAMNALKLVGSLILILFGLGLAFIAIDDAQAGGPMLLDFTIGAFAALFGASGILLVISATSRPPRDDEE